MTDPVAALEAALDSLDGERARVQRALDALRPAAAKPTKARPRRQTRRNGSRAEQIEALVMAEPGITTAEAARKLSTKTQNLYATFAKLVAAGSIRKDERGYRSA